MKIFHDRKEAGKLLAEKLFHYTDLNNAIVLALPRGGVPVGYEISRKLHLPLDVFLVRKLGMPGHEELAFGAIAMGNVQVFNDDVLKMMPISKQQIEAVIASEQKELERRNQKYRHGKPIPDLKNKIVLLVDDGLATGATMRAVVAAIKKMHPTKIIVAVPVAPQETYREFKNIVDEIICIETPLDFFAIGQWYDLFPQTSDEEVIALLETQKKS